MAKITYNQLIKILKETLDEEVGLEEVEPNYTRAKKVVATINASGLVIMSGEELHELVRKGLSCARTEERRVGKECSSRW